MMKVAVCRYPQSRYSKDFQNSQRNYEAESIFGKAEDLTSAADLKMNCSTNIWNLGKPFEQLPLGKLFYLNVLQGISFYGWFYFSVRPI